MVLFIQALQFYVDYLNNRKNRYQDSDKKN